MTRNIYKTLNGRRLLSEWVRACMSECDIAYYRSSLPVLRGAASTYIPPRCVLICRDCIICWCYDGSHETIIVLTVQHTIRKPCLLGTRRHRSGYSMLYYTIQALADCFLLLLLDDGERGLSFFMLFLKARQVPLMCLRLICSARRRLRLFLSYCG